MGEGFWGRATLQVRSEGFPMSVYRLPKLLVRERRMRKHRLPPVPLTMGVFRCLRNRMATSRVKISPPKPNTSRTMENPSLLSRNSTSFSIQQS